MKSLYSFDAKLSQSMAHIPVTPSSELLARALECVAEELRTSTLTPRKVPHAVGTALHAVLDDFLGPEDTEAEGIERIEFVTAITSNFEPQP